MLLKHGADPDVQDRWCNTAYALAGKFSDEGRREGRASADELLDLLDAPMGQKVS